MVHKSFWSLGSYGLARTQFSFHTL